MSSEEEPAAESPQCPACAAPVLSTVKFCAECGHDLRSPEPGAVETVAPTPAPVHTRGASGRLVAALATGVAVIGIALAAVLDEEEPADQKTVGIGEPGVDEDLTFKVTSIEAVQAIPVDEYSDPIVRRQGTKLIRVDLTYKNNTSDGIDPFCGGRSIVLLDRDERNFDPIDNYIDIAGNEICGDELQPGFKRSVTIAFQIPRDSKTLGVVLWNGESDDDYSGELSNVFVSKSGG